jgi:hypothetical protein
MLAPVIAGFLFQGGLPLPTVALMMSFGSVVAAALVAVLKLDTKHSERELETAKAAGT